MHKLISTLFLMLAAAAVLASASPAGASPRPLPLGAGEREIVMPAAWAGIWRIDKSLVDCDSHEILMTTTEDDTTCAGEVLIFDDPEWGFTCTESIDDDTMVVSCTGRMEAYPGCDMVIQFDLTTTRNGDSMTSVQTMTQTTDGPGCEIPLEFCERYESAGTRIAPPPVSCLTPTETRSWGTLKALYR